MKYKCRKEIYTRDANKVKLLQRKGCSVGSMAYFVNAPGPTLYSLIKRGYQK